MTHIKKIQIAEFNQAYVKKASFEKIFQRVSENPDLLMRQNIWRRSAAKMDPNFGSQEISKVKSDLKKYGYGFTEDKPSIGKFLPFKALFFKFIASGKCQEILSKAQTSFSSVKVGLLKQVDEVREDKDLLETLDKLAKAFEETAHSIDVFTVFVENFKELVSFVTHDIGQIDCSELASILPSLLSEEDMRSFSKEIKTFYNKMLELEKKLKLELQSKSK